MRKKIEVIAGIFVIGVILLSMVSQPGMAQEAAVLKVEPEIVGIKPGDLIEISVQGEALQELYGAELHLRFEAAILEIQDADANQDGVQCTPGEMWREGFTALNRVEQQNGRIDFAVTLLNPAPAFSGAGVILKCQARGKRLGSSEIAIESAILATREGTQIAFNAQNGRVEVSESGKASTNESQASTGQSGEQPTEGGKSGEGEVSIYLVIIAIGGLLLFVVAGVVAMRAAKKNRG
ncbi:MAG: cohesin domain-containing protein [Chloroflexota bacterium]